MITKEIEGVFVPRYTMLALEQNRDETRLRLGGIFGQVVARMLALPVGFLAMTLMMRVAPGPWEVLFLGLPPAVLFWPDLLGAVWRRRFGGQLQELTDDLAKVQEANDKLAPVPDVEPTRARPPQREVN